MGIYVYGRNAVQSAISSGKVETLFISVRLKDSSFSKGLLSQYAKDVRYVNDGELARLAETPNHQGCVALVPAYRSYSLDELIAGAKKPYPLLAILDGIEDPHNLGAIIRSADAFGVDGIIIKKRGEVPLNGTVAKVSTGAIDYVKVAVVSNLSQAIMSLKKAGYWIVASDGKAQDSFDEIDYCSPIAVVIGSEGFGTSPLVLKNSDFITKIPMVGHVNSLNASVAASIYFATIASLRRKHTK